MIFSVSSSAAGRPTFGSAPAPRPLVSFAPICSLTGAALHLERLQVGVGDDELDAVEADAHHAVDGVAAAAADADHLDPRARRRLSSSSRSRRRRLRSRRVASSARRLGHVSQASAVDTPRRLRRIP